LAASRVSPGIWWIHNDSGDTARIFAINEKGELRATVNIEGVSAVDWEDIAIETERGDDPDDSDVDTIYVGDIGDGQSKRDNIVVYAIESPKVAVDGPAPATLTAKARAITLTYPDGPHDAEALAYDPSEDELVIVTKDWSMAGVSGIYTADADGTGGVLEREGEFRSKPGTLVTGIDISPDGSLIAVRAYGAVDLFQRGEYADVAVALHSTPCIGPQINESQSEAIGFNADGSSYVTIAEGVGQTLHRTHG
ncbi:MAG TPA: hypothetical protein VL068_09775, partial [Microthrixaceae bacterium]|nr:hypothetical protein [Microthrixaceae bacterium]